MNKLSIFVLFLFTLSAFAVGQPSSGCPDQFRRVQPCAGEILALIRQEQLISSSCCSAIHNATAECPRLLPPLFYRGLEYCHLAKIVSAAPPKPSSALPPKAYPDLKRVAPCIKDIIGHWKYNRTISSFCCATITDIGDKYSQITWPWFTQSRDYCHQSDDGSAAAKPPSRKLLFYNYFPKFPKPSPPPSPPQAPRALWDCPEGHKTLQCLPQFANYASGYKHDVVINSTCCALLLNATQQCGGAEWPDIWYPKALAYCQHPNRDSSPPPQSLPQPSSPPPPPPSPEERVQKCWSFLDTMPSCINEIISGFFDKRYGIGPSCCAAMSSWGDDCFSQLSHQFPDLYYPQWLRQQCSRH